MKTQVAVIALWAAVAFAALSGLACAQTSSGPSIVKFMTYNVRGPGWNPARAAQVIGAIDAEAPDVLGLHEASLFGFGAGADLLAALSDDYTTFHTSTADPIYLRTTRNFIVYDQGVETLPTCSVFGNFVLTWVKVVTPEGARFDFYNTHLCVSFTPAGAGDPEGNQGQAIATAEFMNTNSDPGVGVMAGDLNATVGSPTILYLIEDQPLVLNGMTFDNPIELDDTWETFHGSGVPHPGTTASTGSMTVLDWIMADPGMTILDAEIIQFTIPPGQGAAFSDHLPVTATIALGQPNSALSRLEINGVGTGTRSGPFGVGIPSVGPTITMAWQGPPGQPLILFTGTRNPAHTTVPTIGILDLGIPPSYNDLVILGDGSLGGSFNSLFVLDGTGSAQQSFPLPGLPAGLEINLQGVVGQAAGSPSPFILTAAFYLTVQP